MNKKTPLIITIHFLLVVLLFLASCASTKSSDSGIKIPDTAFKSFLLDNNNINTNYDDEIQLSEAQAYAGDTYAWNPELLANWDSLYIIAPKVLDISNLGISNLTGLEYFTNLEGLICDNNNLKKLDTSKNVKLKILSCSLNKLSKLDISQNKSLKNLICNNNKLQKLDTSANENLLNLDCYENKLKKLAISTNKKITSLDCSQNPLKELNIRANTKLLQLNCNATKLTNLNIQTNTYLTHLWCGENKLAKLDVESNTALQQLDFHSNMLKSVNIKKCPDLAQLSCSFNNFMVVYATQTQYDLYANNGDWITGDALLSY